MPAPRVAVRLGLARSCRQTNLLTGPSPSPEARTLLRYTLSQGNTGHGEPQDCPPRGGRRRADPSCCSRTAGRRSELRVRTEGDVRGRHRTAVGPAQHRAPLPDFGSAHARGPGLTPGGASIGPTRQARVSADQGRTTGARRLALHAFNPAERLSGRFHPEAVRWLEDGSGASTARCPNPAPCLPVG